MSKQRFGGLKRGPCLEGGPRAKKMNCGGKVHKMADGGKVKMKPHKPAKVEDPIKASNPPGGPKTPGAKGTFPKGKGKK